MDKDKNVNNDTNTQESKENKSEESSLKGADKPNQREQKHDKEQLKKQLEQKKAELKQLELIMEDISKGFGDSDDKTYTGKKTTSQLKGKSAMACYIADTIIKPGSTIYLDAGSTVRVIGRAIFAQDVATHLNLTIVTNNMDVLEDFRHLENWLVQASSIEAAAIEHVYRGSRLHLTGGILDEEHHAFFGRLAAATLENVWLDVSIIGATGFCFDSGLFYHGGTEEEAIKEALYSKPVRHRVIACDGSKLGRTDIFLCESKRRDSKDSKSGIEALLDQVDDYVTIVTSEVDKESDDYDAEKERFDREIEKFDKNDKLKKDKKLHLVRVAPHPQNKPPYYDKIKEYPPAKELKPKLKSRYEEKKAEITKLEELIAKL